MKNEKKAKKIIFCVCCIGNIFLLFGCAKTETASADNTVTEESVINTTETITVEMSETVQVPSEQLADPPPEYKIIMVGDILLHTPVEESCLQPDGSYDYDSLFSHTKEEIAAADLALVNQEVIIGGADLGITGYPSFNADFSLCDSLAGAGFDIICHATNHAMDKGRKGLINCAKYWRENYPQITVLGIHDTADTSTSCGAEPVILDLPDMKIAVLNYTYGTNGIQLPDDMPYAVDLLNEEQVAADIQRAEELADFTIVCPHWGTEYRLTSDASQEKWTKIFAENGADLILGTHPHVIEPIEWVTDEAGEHEMLVYYSLGNFVNWTSGTGEGVANRMVGGMAEVTITKNDHGEVEIADYGVKPMISHVASGPEGVTTYFLEDYPEELAEENEIVSQDPEFSREYCVNLCDSVWGDLWKTE
jgi:poly-gamma-glutamate synthesis protein (capsule biosynthesis protein)